MDVDAVKQKVPAFAFPIARAIFRASNRILARKLEFAIIGTGRCGTTFVAKYLTRISIPCSHELYFTANGPEPRNPGRPFDAKGDASWMAVPFVGEFEIPVLHQVRDPYDVVRSLFQIGFFDPKFREQHGRYIGFALRHFWPSDDPLDSCIRWYIEWNRRCEGVADLRFRVEDFDAELPAILSALGYPRAAADADVSRNVNSRPSVYAAHDDDRSFDDRFFSSPRIAELSDLAEGYGYRIAPGGNGAPTGGDRGAEPAA